MLWRDLAAIFEYSLCNATIAQWRLAQYLARWAGKMISLSAGLHMACARGEAWGKSAAGGGVFAGQCPPGQAPPCGIERLFMRGPLGRKAGKLLPVGRGMIHMAQVAQLMPAQVLQQRRRQKQSAPVEADAPLGACRREG